MKTEEKKKPARQETGKDDKSKDSHHRSMFSIELYVTLALVVLSAVAFSIYFLMVNADLAGENVLERLRTESLISLGTILMFTLVYTVVYSTIRVLLIYRPMKKIQYATQRIRNGDFSVRIKTRHKSASRKNEFDIIIENLNIMAEELGSIETLKSDFIANVSHEIKTPLAVIQSAGTALINPDISDEDRIINATTVTQATMRLSELISNMLKLNKLENQEIFADETEFDICEQLRIACIDFESLWELKNIDINLDMPDELMVKSDYELLDLVWHNLLSNAFKFTEDNGVVTVKIRKSKDKVYVTVGDTGCGMTPETKARIFDKFYQGDTSHKTAGNGLGLALVSKIVNILNGKIEIESEYGKGSEFTVIL